MKTFSIFLTCLFFLHISRLSGQAPGSLDLSFESEGFIIDTLGNGEDYYAGMLTIPDGKHYVSASVRSAPTGAYPYFHLKRLLANGQTDPTFSPVIGGTVASSYLGGSYAGKINVQDDGKFLVAGETYYSPNTYAVLARFNIDGSLDSTFSPGGSVSNYGSAVFDFVTSEGGGNIFTPTTKPIPLDIKFDNNNNIFICGNVMRNHPINNNVVINGYVAKVTNDGTLDSSFSDDGHIIIRIQEQLDPISIDVDIYSTVEQIEVLEDGKILAIGEFKTDYVQIPFGYVARFNPDGTFDEDFATNGVLVIDDCQSPGEGYHSFERMVVHQNGSITLIGNDYTSFVCRILPNGEFDNSFGSNGRKSINFDNYGDILLFEELDNGKYLVGTSNSIKRFNADFSLDYSFRNYTFDYNYQNIPIGSIPTFYSGEVTDDGEIYLVGANNAGSDDGIKNSLIVKIEESECDLPEISQVSDVYGNLGGTATISFDIPNALSFRWQIASTYNYCQVSTSGWTNISNGTTYSGVTSSELTISNLTQALDGKVYRCLVQTDDCGGTSEEVTLHIGENPTSVIHVSNESMNAYPNPAGDFIRISSTTEMNDFYQILDIHGKIVQAGKMTGENLEINLNLFAKGLYRFQLERGDGLNFIRE
ncbi:MAG: T9SS type A sorting domain-containing protein [Bacteroidia bacterium]